MELSIDQVRTKAREHIVAKYRTQAIAAKAFGCCVSYLNEVLTGKAQMPDWLMMEIGVSRVTLYVDTQVATAAIDSAKQRDSRPIPPPPPPPAPSYGRAVVVI